MECNLHRRSAAFAGHLRHADDNYFDECLGKWFWGLGSSYGRDHHSTVAGGGGDCWNMV